MSYTPEQLLEAADILDRAHDVILRDGWAPMMSDVVFGDRHCMESAVNEALGFARCSNLSLPDLVDVGKLWLYSLIKDHDITYIFNDARDRTEDEVLDRMRSAAKELREEAGAL